MSKYNDEERKKREEEFDAMFSNNTINNSDYQQRATEFDNVFGGNNIDYQTRTNEFDAMFGNKQEELIDTKSKVDDNNGIDLSKYPDLEPGDSVEKTVIGLNKKDIAGIQQYGDSEETQKKKEIVNMVSKAKTEHAIDTKNKVNDKSNNQETILKTPLLKEQTNDQKATPGEIYNFVIKKNNNKVEITPELIQELANMNDREKNVYIDTMTNDKEEKANINIKIHEYKQAQRTQKEAEKIDQDIANGNYISSLWHIIKGLPQEAINSFIKIETAIGSFLPQLKGNMSINNIIDATKVMTGEYIETNSKIKNDVVRTAGSVSGTIGAMIPSIIANIIAPGSGNLTQAVTVGSSEYLDTLNEDNSNKGQALLTGILKGAASYQIEKLAGGNFLSKGSLDDIAHGTIANKFSNKYAQRIASILYDIGGEVAEEQIENQAGYIIDKLVSDKDITAEQWWSDFSETNKNTVLTTIVLGMFGLGGNTYREVLNEKQLKEIDSKTEKSIKEITTIMDKENITIKKPYFVLDTDGQGNISTLTQTTGQEIELKNTDLNVTPVVVYQNGYYDVIDGKSGTKLDTSGYTSVDEAINGFNDKISKASKESIDMVNSEVVNSKLALINKFQEIEAYQKMYNNDVRNYKNSSLEDNTKLEEISTLTNQIQDKTIYNNQEAVDIFDYVSSYFDNMKIERTNIGKDFLYLVDQNGKIINSFELSNKRYNGKKIKEIINTAVDGVLPNRIQTTTEQNTGNLNVEPVSYTNEQQNLTQGDVNKGNGTSNNPSESNFYTGNKKYSLKDINKTTGYFKNNKQYKLPDIEEIYNFDMETEDITTYDDKGNETGYIDIVQNGENVKIQQYDNEDNVIKEQIIPSKNGKVSGKAVNEAIKKLTNDYDVNRPIKGQLDVEGNQVKNMKKSKMTDEQIRDIVKYNQDGREIKDENYVDFMVERYKDNINISNIETDTSNVNQLLDKTYKQAQIITKSENENKIKNKQKELMIKELFKDINDKDFISVKKLRNKEGFLETKKLNIEISKSGLKESFNKSISDEKYAVVPFLDKLIKTANDGTIRNETKERRNIDEWYYLYNTAIVNNQLYSVKIDIKKTNQGDKFYVHRLNIIKEEIPSTSVSIVEDDTKRSNDKSSIINNSIPQKEQNVKNETVINKQSMQKKKNNTSNDDIRSMKKNKTENKNNPIKINSDGEAKYIDENQKEHDIYFRFDAKGGFKGKEHRSGDSMWENQVDELIDEKQESYYDEENEDYIENNPLLEEYGVTRQEYDDMSYEECLKIKMKIADDYLHSYPESPDVFPLSSGASSIKLSKDGIDVIGSNMGTLLYEYSTSDDDIVTFYTGNLQNDIGIWDEPIVKPDRVIYTGNSKEIIEILENVVPNKEKIKKIAQIINNQDISNDDIRYMKKDNNQKQSNEAKRTIRPEKGKTNIEREDSFIEQEIQQLEKTNNFDPNIPMTKISDIVKDIEKYLKSRILTKYIDYRSYGIYKVNRDIIRVQEKSDLDTILHEMAHMLDNRLHLQKENLALELLTKDVWKLYGKYPESIQLEEGFAEVVRQYYIQPEKAKNKYPDTIKFIEDLRKSDQAFDNFSSKLQQDIYNYIHQTENNRAKSRISAKEIKERQSLKEMKDTVIDRTITALWDEDYKLQKYTDRLAKIAGFQDIYQVPNSENPVVANRLKKGIANAIDDMLKHGIIDKQTGKRVTRGLSEIDTILENEDIADFSTYLLSLRSIEAFEKGKKTGIRYNDAKAVVEKGNKNSNFLKAKEIIQEYNDGLLEYAKEGGILSDEQIDTIKKYWLNYVPMFRVQENISNQNQKNNGNPLKRFIGSDRDIINPLEGIITNTINIVSQVNKNTVIKQFYDLGEYAGLTDEVYDILTTPPVKKVATATLEMFKKELEKQGVDTSTLDLEVIYDIYYPDERDRPNELITSFKVDGERKYIQFFDKDLYKIFTNINARELNGLEKIINFANSIFKAGTTGVNLAFAIPNMISDSQQAYVMSEAKFLPIYSSAKGVYDTVMAQLKANGMIKNTDKNTELELMYSIYLQSGASQAGRISRYRKDLEQQLIEIYKKSYKDFGMKKNQLKEFEKAAKYVCELSEEATRFENFILELQKAIKEGKSPQEAIATAAINTRNLTIDFAVKGELSKVINVVVPYFSAKMAGIYNAYGKVQKTKSNAKASYQKTMAEQIQSANDVQRAKKEARKMAVKSVRKPILTLLSLIAFNMIRKAFTDDDDKVKELNDQKKYDNYVFSDPFNDNEVITIKKPQGVLRDIINTAEFLQDLVSGNIEEGKAGEKFVELIKAIAENNSGTDTVGGLIPPFIKVPVELGVNKDFYYNSEIVKENDLKNLKPKDQYYEYNTTASIGLGQVFNVSPAKIDFSIRGLFGQAAFDLWSGFSSVIDLISGNEKADLGASNKYLLKRFFANPDNNSNSLNEFYDKLNELNVKDNYNELTKEEKTQYENMKIASSSISKINKQIKEIKADDNLSGDEKGEKIIELQNQRTDTARQALGKSLIDTSNTTKIETTKFYPSRSTLTNNGYSLVMTTEMQKEYSQIASDKYNQYAKQGIYSDEYLEKLETKCKEYAKNYMMNKYKSQLTKSK